MDLGRSRPEVPELLWRDAVGSTNSELVALAADPALPTFAALVTDDQTAGRGRLDRAWTAPAGTALAISVLVRGPSLAAALETDALGWLPLAAGLAMSDAVTEVLPSGARVGVKWPNDVQIDGRKVCGILSELVPPTAPPTAAPPTAAPPTAAPPTAAPPGVAVVIGAGLNVTMSQQQLPVPTATSLVLAGAERDELFDRVLAAYLRALTTTITALADSGGDAELSGLRAAVIQRCTTIGREVRVELPGGAELFGSAVGIDRLGRLELRESNGRVRAVAAGDIIHLR